MTSLLFSAGAISGSAVLTAIAVACAAVGYAICVRHRLHTDELTGLGNRITLQRLARRAARRRQHGRLVGLVMLDLNDFKQINDTYGHTAGNCVLAAFATRIRNALERGEYGIRLHGDEFAIWLPNLTDTSDRFRLQALQIALTGPLWIRDHHIPVTASFGAIVAPAGTALSDLLAEADRRMYATKHRHHTTQLPNQSVLHPAA